MVTLVPDDMKNSITICPLCSALLTTKGRFREGHCGQPLGIKWLSHEGSLMERLFSLGKRKQRGDVIETSNVPRGLTNVSHSRNSVGRMQGHRWNPPENRLYADPKNILLSKFGCCHVLRLSHRWRPIISLRCSRWIKKLCGDMGRWYLPPGLPRWQEQCFLYACCRSQCFSYFAFSVDFLFFNFWWLCLVVCVCVLFFVKRSAHITK